jgi:hypothetical protein
MSKTGDENEELPRFDDETNPNTNVEELPRFHDETNPNHLMRRLEKLTAENNKLKRKAKGKKTKGGSSSS